jgi:hypothetical protein
MLSPDCAILGAAAGALAVKAARQLDALHHHWSAQFHASMPLHHH